MACSIQSIKQISQWKQVTKWYKINCSQKRSDKIVSRFFCVAHTKKSQFSYLYYSSPPHKLPIIHTGSDKYIASNQMRKYHCAIIQITLKFQREDLLSYT